MSKKTIKVISILAIVLCVVMAVAPVFAAIDPNLLTGNDTTDPNLTNWANKIIGVIKNIGIIISVVILMVIGIKYMLGSAEEKAEYKKTMMPYIVGAAILFGASTIAGIVMNFFK